jgi:UDP-N-acetyl-D-mannosaminuronate dehydrogenase
VKRTFREVNTGLASPQKIRIRAMGVSMASSAAGSHPYCGLPRGTSWEATKATGLGIPANASASAAYSRVAGIQISQIVVHKVENKKWITSEGVPLVQIAHSCPVAGGVAS